jgi:hypothetical protein
MQIQIPLADRLRYAWEAFSRTHKPDPAAQEKLNDMPEAEFENALTHLRDNVAEAAQRIVKDNATNVDDLIAVMTGLYGVQWDHQRTIMAYIAKKAPGITFLPIVQKWIRDNSSRMDAAFGQ